MSQALLSVRIEGDTSFRFAPAEVVAEAASSVPGYMNAGMLVIRDQARVNVTTPAPGLKYPSDVTGTLKRSIDVEPVVQVASTFVGTIKADAAQAAVIEHGRKPGKGIPFRKVRMPEYDVQVRGKNGRKGYTRKAGGGEVAVYANDEWLRHPRTLDLKGDDPKALRERASVGYLISRKIKALGIAARNYMARAVAEKGEEARALTIRLYDAKLAEIHKRVLPGVR